VALSPTLPDEASGFLDQVDDPRFLVYLVASNAGLSMDDGQNVLETLEMNQKIRLLISRLTRQKEILTLGRKIKSDAKEELDKAQKRVFPAATDESHSEGTRRTGRRKLGGR